MAIYDVKAKVVQRSQERSVIAVAASHAAVSLHDDMLGRMFNYLDKAAAQYLKSLLIATPKPKL